MLTLTSQFVFVFRALAYHFYYQSMVWTCIYMITDRSSIGSSCHSSSSNFFVIDKTNINMPILVNYGKQTYVGVVQNQINMLLAS